VVEFCKHSHNSWGFIDAEIIWLTSHTFKEDNVAGSYKSELINSNEFERCINTLVDA